MLLFIYNCITTKPDLQATSYKLQATSYKLQAVEEGGGGGAHILFFLLQGDGGHNKCDHKLPKRPEVK